MEFEYGVWIASWLSLYVKCPDFGHCGVVLYEDVFVVGKHTEVCRDSASSLPSNGSEKICI